MSGLGPQGVHRFQRREAPLFVALIFGAVAVVILGITMMFTLDLASQFFDVLVPIVNGPGDSGPTDIQEGYGNGFTMLAVSVLSIPAALLLAALLGGDSGMLRGDPPRRPPRSGGPPF